MAELDRIGVIEKPKSESIGEKLCREGELLASLPVQIVKGVTDHALSIVSSKEQMITTGTEMAISGMIAVTVGVLARRPGMIGTVAQAAPKAFALLAGADMISRVAPPVYDTWRSAENLNLAKQQLGANLGAAFVDYTLMGASAHVGFRYGAPAYRVTLDRIEFGQAPVRMGTAPQRASFAPADYPKLFHTEVLRPDKFAWGTRTVETNLPPAISIAALPIVISDLVGQKF